MPHSGLYNFVLTDSSYALVNRTRIDWNATLLCLDSGRLSKHSTRDPTLRPVRRK